MGRLRGSRGAALAIVMITALVSAITIYTAFMVAMNQARQAKFFRGRTPARYLAEAGLMVAQAHLWTAPDTYCGGTQQIDTNGNGALDVGEPSVVITVTPCTRPLNTPVTVQVRASN